MRAQSPYHSTAANLVLLEGLLNLLQHGKVTDVNTDTLAGGTERAKSVANIDIDLASVGLTGDDESGAEASLLGDELIQSLDLVVVTVEDLEEGSLSTGGTLDTTEAQVITSALKVTQIHQQILDPKTSTLANGNQLSGLTVSETQSGQVLVLLSELGQLVDDNSQLGDQDVKTVTEQNQVSVIGTVARGSTPVDDTGSSGSNLAKGVDVGHDIVATTLLLLGGNGELVVLDGGVGLHLLESLIADGKSKLYISKTQSIECFAFRIFTISSIYPSVQSRTFLGLGQPDPKLAPGGESHARGKEILHLSAYSIGLVSMI